MKQDLKINDIQGLTNKILFEDFNFGIEKLKLSNLVFENLEYIVKK